MSAAGIGLLILAHVADYTTFVVMVSQKGLGSELNPVVVTIAADWGLALLTVAKFATVLFVAATFLVVGRTRPRLATAVLAFGIFIGVLGATSNIATIDAGDGSVPGDATALAGSLEVELLGPEAADVQVGADPANVVAHRP